MMINAPRGPECGRHFVVSPAEAERFWAKVVKSDGCWTWAGARCSSGYGRFPVRSNRVLTGAHRVAYVIANGPIPDGKSILHTCDVPSCVRPDHLRAGTHAENMRDMVTKGRNKPRRATGRRVVPRAARRAAPRTTVLPYAGPPRAVNAQEAAEIQRRWREAAA